MNHCLSIALLVLIFPVSFTLSSCIKLPHPASCESNDIQQAFHQTAILLQQYCLQYEQIKHTGNIFVNFVMQQQILQLSGHIKNLNQQHQFLYKKNLSTFLIGEYNQDI